MIAYGIVLAAAVGGPLAPPQKEPDRVAKAERDLAAAETQLAALRRQLDVVGEQVADANLAFNAAVCARYRAEQAFADFRSNYPAWEADPGIAAEGRRLRAETADARDALDEAWRSVRICSELADCHQAGVNVTEAFLVLTRRSLEQHRRDAAPPKPRGR